MGNYSANLVKEPFVMTDEGLFLPKRNSTNKSKKIISEVIGTLF